MGKIDLTKEMAVAIMRDSIARDGTQVVALTRLLETLQQLQRRIESGAHDRLLVLSSTHPSLGLNPSVRNLQHYLEFRSLDQRQLQGMLTEQRRVHHAQ